MTRVAISGAARNRDARRLELTKILARSTSTAAEQRAASAELVQLTRVPDAEARRSSRALDRRLPTWLRRAAMPRRRPVVARVMRAARRVRRGVRRLVSGIRASPGDDAPSDPPHSVADAGGST